MEKTYRPSPIELMHGAVLDKFHQWRLEQTGKTSIMIDGHEMNEIIVAAKKIVYAEYPELKPF